MVRPLLTCPKCGQAVERKGVGILVSSDHLSGKVHSEKRVFRSYCPEDGWFDDDEIPKAAGHHSTIWNSTFKLYFPKTVQDELRRYLSAEEWRAFVEMREGRRRADWDWLSGLSSKFIKTPLSALLTSKLGRGKLI
jgi:hypothetical protein